MKIFKNCTKHKLFYAMKGCIPKIIYAFMLILLFIPNCSYANSSWHWISNSRPYDVLPFVIVLTLAIETLSIFKFSPVENKLKTFVVVLVVNILSFAAPYIFHIFFPGYMYTFYDWLEQSPFYTIGEYYLFTTIIIEFPIIFNFLKQTAKNKKILVLTIVSANILTTLMTYVAERIFCRGSW